jgi:serine/threonine protein kinase
MRPIGSGGAADVFLYRHVLTSRPVAVKVDRHSLTGAEAQQRFRTEAKSMARLTTHPNILTIYDAGITENSHGYLVLEYAPQGSYKRRRLKEHVSLDEVLSVGISLCGALQTAHSQGIIHHDIKPSNILISDIDTPLLSDFGIAGDIYDASLALGYSIPWAPREILTEETPGNEASDIYSLGASLIGILTGRSPYELAFSPTDATQLKDLIETEELPSFAAMGIPSTIEEAVAPALATDPEKRYYSALEFGRALQNTQQQLFGHANPLTAPDTPEFESSAHAPRSARKSAPHARTGRHYPKPRTIVVAAIAAVLAVAGGVALWLGVVAPHADSVMTTVRQSTTTPPSSGDPPSQESSVASVTETSGKIEGTTATFTWKDPTGDDNSYFWKRIDATSAQSEGVHTDETSVRLRDVTESQVCIQVSIVTASHAMSESPATICAVRTGGSHQ